jgi:twinkle protein
LTDIATIKLHLRGQVESVCGHLLPNGKKKSGEWRVGSVDGEEGQSLGVHLGGAKAGVWSDFSTGETGDLIDLWMAVRRIGLEGALAEMRDWLRLERPRPHREPKRDYLRPPKPKCAAPRESVLTYLTGTRKIPAEILARYKIGERGNVIVFPFLLPSGELVLAKERLAEDGARPKPTASNCEPILFGWQAIDPNSREVVLTEGEADACSWAAYGFPAMSVPFGGGKGAKQQWIESEFERMERFERIYLALDMDRQGDEAAEEIASRLGRHRCYRVRMPYKDGNECLMQGVPVEEMARAIAEAVNLDPEGLRKPSDFVDHVTYLLWPAAGDHVGYCMPYGKLKDKLLFRPAELSLWSGASGSGKSQIISDCVVDWVKQGSRVCLSSLEMKAAQTLKRMCKQLVGIERPTAKAIEMGLTWLDNGLLLYELVGKSNIEAILAVFDYARGKYGCDQFIIDSLMRLGVAGDDYTAQEKIVFQLVDWVIAHNVHLHLVAHSRKGASQSGAPETEDIKGAMEIGANAFNIITVWRNRSLEDEIRKAEASKDESALMTLREKPGVMVNIAKQRNGDFEGKAGLWFDKSCYRYYSSYDRGLWTRSYLQQEFNSGAFEQAEPDGEMPGVDGSRRA